jgi:hypothetical protein
MGTAFIMEILLTTGLVSTILGTFGRPQYRIQRSSRGRRLHCVGRLFFTILLFLNDFSPFSDIPVQIGERQAQSQTSGDRESNIQGPRTLAPHF